MHEPATHDAPDAHFAPVTALHVAPSASLRAQVPRALDWFTQSPPAHPLISPPMTPHAWPGAPRPIAVHLLAAHWSPPRLLQPPKGNALQVAPGPSASAQNPDTHWRVP